MALRSREGSRPIMATRDGPHVLVGFVGPGAESLPSSVDSAPGVVTITEQAEFPEYVQRCSKAEVYLAELSVEDIHWLAASVPPRTVALY